MTQTSPAPWHRQAIWSCAVALLLGVLSSVAFAQDPSAATQPAAAQTGAASVSNTVSTEPDGYFAEPAVITRVTDLVNKYAGEDGGDAKNGFYPEFGNLPSGSGWISIGPGYRHWLFDGNAFVDASAAISWRAYKMGQMRFELPRMGDRRLLLGAQVKWQDLTQVSYYGEGPDSLEGDRSEYELKSTNVVQYGTLRVTDNMHVGYAGGWIGGIQIGPPTGAFLRHYPFAGDQFPDNASFVQDVPTFLYGEASLLYDNRDYRSHPANGGFYRIAWSGYSDRHTDLYTFQRAELEAEHFEPLGSPKAVLAVHGWLVDSVTTDGHAIPSYMEPVIGGSETIRAFSNYRFRDYDMVIANIETRFAVWQHVDAALFVDAGNVAHHVNDLNFDKRAYGAGLRIHTRKINFGRMDVAHGSEGWQVLFRIGDPLHFSRLSQRVAQIPFVP